MRVYETMIFETGKHYRHMATLDVDVKVLLVQWVNDDEVGMKIRYWNRKYGFFYSRRQLGDMDEYVAIQKKDFWKWKEVPRERVNASG